MNDEFWIWRCEGVKLDAGEGEEREITWKAVRLSGILILISRFLVHGLLRCQIVIKLIGCWCVLNDILKQLRAVDLISVNSALSTLFRRSSAEGYNNYLVSFTVISIADHITALNVEAALGQKPGDVYWSWLLDSGALDQRKLQQHNREAGWYTTLHSTCTVSHESWRPWRPWWPFITRRRSILFVLSDEVFSFFSPHVMAAFKETNRESQSLIRLLANSTRRTNLGVPARALILSFSW